MSPHPPSLWHHRAVRIYTGYDHAAFDEMQQVIAHLTNAGHDVTNHGPTTNEPLDDYPEFCIKAAQAVVADPGSIAIVAGGSGNGEQMAANKVAGIRAALAWKPELAQLAREHNDANVLSIGARMHSMEELLAIVDAFLTTDYSGQERHSRRIGQMRHFENTGTVLASETPVTHDGTLLP